MEGGLFHEDAEEDEEEEAVAEEDQDGIFRHFLDLKGPFLGVGDGVGSSGVIRGSDRLGDGG